jgi:hypothetical protein
MASSQSPVEAAATFTDIFGNDEELPTARLISPTDQQGLVNAVPLAPEYGYIVEDAIAVPGEDGIPSAVQGSGRVVINRATRRGLISAEQELEDIQRANANVWAQNYYARAAVNEANRLSRNRTQLDNLVSHNSSTTSDRSSDRDEKLIKESISSRVNKSAGPQGTFGQDYEVSEYDVTEYATRDYDVSNYKSVYER